MAAVSVRYIVDDVDVDAALAFYCRHLGFTEQMHPAPAFAMVARGDLRLLLSAPGKGPGGGGHAMPDGTLPTREAGTGSPSRAPTWPAPWTGSARPASTSAVTRSPAWAAGRS